SPVAGSAVTISAQLADANNNPVTTAGVVLTWSKSDLNGAFASATSTSDANGLASVIFTTHTAAGTATTVTATDAGSLTGTTPAITTISGAAAKYILSASNYSPGAGSAVTISAQLADVNNNPVTTAGVVLTWSKSDLNGAFASATSTTDANGLASVMFTTHTVAATATTITATDAGSLTGTTPVITTVSGMAVKLVITGSGNQIAGDSQDLSISALDANNNKALTYSGDKSLIFGGADSSGNPIISPTVKDKTGAVIPFGSSTIITFVGGSATVVSGKNGVMTLYKAELATIAVTDQNISATGDDRLNVNVSAAGFNKLVVSLTSIQTSSIPFTGTNSLIAQDVYGNTVSNFKSSENNVLVSTSLEGVISGLSGTNILNNHSDFNAGVANLTTLGLTFSGLPATGTFTFTPSNGIAATSGDVSIHAGTRQATPTFSPVAGAIAFGTTVTISSPGADAIYYTTDGSNPTTSSTNQALTPLIINSAVTVKALAVRSGSDNSNFGIASYTQAISADLTSLVVSGNPSNYIFTGNNYIYPEVKTTYDVASIIITPTGIGTITVNGVIITSGNSSAPINLTPGIDHIITVTVTEIGKSPKTYTIHVKRALSSAKSITAFDFTSPAIQGVVNEASKVITISVPFGTSLTGLVPIINHTGASVSPTSGEAHNFIAGVPAIYTVTAADASTQNYSVSITYSNEPPTDIVLSATTLFENQESGTLAGTLNSLSNNINNSFNYSLISGSGDTDNDKFIITNKEIRTSQLFDYEKQKTYSVRIRSTTQQGSSLDKSFIIQISDINEAPTLDEIANQSICYSSSEQIISLGPISAGPETGQLTITSISSDNPGLFKSPPSLQRISGIGNQISYTIAPDQSGTATLTVRVKDNGGTNNGGVDEIIRTCIITVNPLNQVDIISNKGTTIARGETAQLTASGGNTYQWLNSSGIITGQNSASLQVRPMQTTSYTVLVTNATG
ncbi:MAG TPA: chitobiase/beta-hexosaminidase C-terminal domain-containing protein, partial [Sphingobacteriaceae bacterium]